MDVPTVNEAPPAVDATRWLAVASLAGLVAVQLAMELWAAPAQSLVWVAIKLTPLMLPLAGILRRRMYTYRWVSLLLWIYFAEGVVRAWSVTNALSRALALAEIVLCLALFAACAFHVRLRLKKAAP